MSLENSVPYLCECNSFKCRLEVWIPIEEAVRRNGQDFSYHWVIIVDGCKTGPEPGEILKEKHDGYGFYGMPLD
jgi:hypothetical protein